MEKAKYERFEKIAKSKRLSNYRIAKDTGVAQETLSSWKKGKYTPKADKLDIIADYLGVPVEYFYYDSEESEQKDRINHYYEQLKTYEVSAGNGRINETADTFKPSEGRCARIVGDSMLPTLRDGDYVRIEETPDVTPQDYAVVRINGDEMTIKHVEIIVNDNDDADASNCND